MVYRYSRNGLMMEGLIAVVFMGSALLNVPTPFRVLGVVLGLLTLKDVFRNLKTEYQLTDRGLVKRFLGRTDYCMTWNQLRQITVGKYNKSWIVLLGDTKPIYTLRPSYIENYQELAKEIIQGVRKHHLKDVVLHPDIPKRLNMQVKVNGKGCIMS